MEAERLNLEVFPRWLDSSIPKQTRAEHAASGEIATAYDLLQQLVFFIDTKPNCISHTVRS